MSRKTTTKKYADPQGRRVELPGLRTRLTRRFWARVLRSAAQWVDMGAYVTAKAICGPRVQAIIHNPRAWQWTPLYLLLLAEAVEAGDLP